MAKATQSIPEPRPITVTLELTFEEAQALRALLGDASSGNGMYEVFKALKDAGVDRGRFEAYSRGVYGVRRSGGSGEVTF